MSLNTIFFIGPQGSGKGTQARVLAERLGFFYWEMGGILREVSKNGTALGNKIKQQIDAGILLSDELLLEVVTNRLTLIPLEQGVIFDGIPRRLDQAEFLLNFLQHQGRKNFTTLFIDVPKEESLKRLTLRAQKEGRADDTPEKIEVRLKQYYQDTLPVIDYLKGRTNFVEINGLQSVEEVTKSINQSLSIV